MGFEERWQRRQQEIAADTDTREADRVRRHNDRVEKIHQQHVQAARQAFERGDGWFEAEIPQHAVGRLDVHAVLRTKHDHPDVPRPARGDLLSRIEDEGWTLHTAQYLYVPTGEESRDKIFSSGQQIRARGDILGIYLFQRHPDTSRPAQSPSSQRSGQTG
ncbi:hypothetical protein [Streptomyces antibioticus]|uniref:hypothetical protein n=1 Tax=Streptomyces antibioticus TaxID=1890 RepID=UPI0036A4D1AA